LFTDAQITAAVTATAGAAGLLAPHLPIPARPGRPRLLTVEGLLAGLHLACADGGGAAVHLAAAADILHRRIPARWRERFGIGEVPAGAAGFEALSARVRRLFHALLAPMDPSPLPKNLRIPRQDAAGLAGAGDPGAAHAARALLVAVSNEIVEASIAGIRPLMDAHWDGAAAVDATVLAAFARGTPTLGPVTSTDPDAGWYVRTGDHRDPDTQPGSGSGSGKRTKRVKKTVFGYEATLVPLAVSKCAPDLPGLPAGTHLPSVIVAFAVDRPGADPGGNAIRALADMRLRRGHKPGPLAADRAYNNSVPEDFQLPVRALGYAPAYDYPVTALGIQAPGPGGTVLIEGGWHCPAVPAELADATKTLHAAIDAADRERDTLKRAGAFDEQATEAHRAAKNDARTDWTAAITARAAFAMAPKGRPDAGGHQRYCCPAAAGTLACPLKPASRGGHRRALPLIDPAPTPGGPPTACTQSSITIEPAAGAKHWQPLLYGSQPWQQQYHQLRATVEGVNGHLKDGAFENFQNSAGRRVRGIAATTFLAAFQIAHANTRKIRNWRATLPTDGRPPDRRARRRTTADLGDWTPRGYLPPAAAGSRAGPAPPDPHP
jgi:hypothetical protein